MLTFQETRLSDLPLLREYLLEEPRTLCLYTPGTLLMWRRPISLRHAVFDATLILQTVFGGAVHHLMPRGKSIPEALREIEEYCAKNSLPFLLADIEECDKNLILSLYPHAEAEEMRDEANYLYHSEDLARFPGRRYNGQRNHLNRFRRLFPEARLLPIEEESLPRLLDFVSHFRALRASDDPFFLTELSLVEEVLRHYREYGLLGAYLEAEGRILAFSAGEIVGDVLQVHIEKADTTASGSYQAMVSGFASLYAEGRVPLINREDDMGVEGMRISKLSYHPCELKKSYRIKI